MDEQVNPLDRDHCLSVVLPGGLEKHATVHGSKPVMDLLVTLCASYHLNPSDYTVEVLSPNKNNIRFKPNSPIGSLEADKIVLKPKATEEKIRRPYMPEPSVRLLINYNKSHKAVVRVNPQVPIELLMPAVCDKCEFQVETTILLRDALSNEPLDLTKSLNEHGVREVFAKDTGVEHQQRDKTPETAVTPTEVITPPPQQDPPQMEKKQKENSGFLSLFRKKKKKTQTEGSQSAPPSPGLKLGVSANVQSVSSSSNTLTVDMPKKRRAPQPPMGGSLSVPNNLTTCHRSAESTLRSTKRRAPPPPCVNHHLEPHADTEGTLDSLHPLADLQESDESDSIALSFSSSSSPRPSQSRSSSSFSHPSRSRFHEVAEHLPSLRGKDLSDARCALAKVLTSSVSKGALVRRLGSATLPKLRSSSFMSVPHRRSENGLVCVELDPNLPTDPVEPEWEDPIQRRMTTFKVVPSKKQRSTDAEITLRIPEHIQIEKTPTEEASMQVGDDQPEAEEDPLRMKTPSMSPEHSSEEAPKSPPDLDLDSNLGCESSSPSDVGETIERDEEEESESSSEEVKADEEEPEALSEVVKAAEEEPEALSEVVKAAEEEPEASSEVVKAAEEEPEAVIEVVKAAEEEPEASSEVVKAAEEEPEAVIEVVQAAEELPSEFQSNCEDQSDVLRSLSRESAESETVNCTTNAPEKDIEEDGDDCFPPPPPPVFFSEDVDATTASSQPPYLTLNGQITEEHQNGRSTASLYKLAVAETPEEELSASPSRFAQAVALAVQRSRSQSHGKTLGPPSPSGPHSTLPSSPRSIYQFGA
ncbi:protein cordon-bleu-like isoform X2 [Notolabrus celidotus]|uniref:protein cordon-bleu-like isoform X2 n=1 Tax=Notolabrus celidotus TaxID=1203425 RepID=UPI00148FB719|nr:protein cordon-bleu-like isoform X2 [Notolabrus celidotus]XP_034533540.1 protein cordon-bleu-like isoform X2 [Notolabrus celidotus]